MARVTTATVPDQLAHSRSSELEGLGAMALSWALFALSCLGALAKLLGLRLGWSCPPADLRAQNGLLGASCFWRMTVSPTTEGH